MGIGCQLWVARASWCLGSMFMGIEKDSQVCAYGNPCMCMAIILGFVRCCIGLEVNIIVLVDKRGVFWDFLTRGTTGMGIK